MVAAVAMFAAASCVQELDNKVPEQAGETVVFTASVDEADTKAVLNETTKTSEWVKGDKITLHNGTKGYEFSAKAAGRSVSFEYTGNDFSGSKFMAVYPAGTYTANSKYNCGKVLGDVTITLGEKPQTEETQEEQPQPGSEMPSEGSIASASISMIAPKR